MSFDLCRLLLLDDVLLRFCAGVELAEEALSGTLWEEELAGLSVSRDRGVRRGVG